MKQNWLKNWLANNNTTCPQKTPLFKYYNLNKIIKTIFFSSSSSKWVLSPISTWATRFPPSPSLAPVTLRVWLERAFTAWLQSKRWQAIENKINAKSKRKVTVITRQLTNDVMIISTSSLQRFTVKEDACGPRYLLWICSFKQLYLQIHVKFFKNSNHNLT